MKREVMIDYPALWRDLVELADERRQQAGRGHEKDQWKGKAVEFEQRVKERWQQKDSSRDFLLQTLKDFPESTVLDVGAGSGAWASWLASHALSITALDTSASMLAQLHARIAMENLKNVKVLAGCWPDIEVEAHDICFCSHSMYGAKDLAEFVLAMQKVCRKRVILLIRAPQDDGLMAQAARLVWGHPYDSPNYQIAMQILWQQGIFPNVVMEADKLWKPWTHSSQEEALVELKSRLGLFTNAEWDEALKELLEKNLQQENGQNIWPAAMRTALLYWDITR